MTNEEAFKLAMQACKETWNEKTCKQIKEALEQEPCDDAISRKDIQDYIAKYLSQYLYEDVRQAVEAIDTYIGDMPSVTPQQKYGKWILSGGYWRCSECKEKALLKLDKSKGGCREYEPVRSKHCPSCGIEMQESEDKE